MDLPMGVPTSDIFEVRETPSAGRAVFSKCDIPADTVVWRPTDLSLSVVLREYRREVCGQCFVYDYGNDLPVRNKEVGFAFCSERCQAIFSDEQGPIGIEAWTAAEKLIKGRSKEDADMVELDQPRPKTEDITSAWEGAAAQAALIRIARLGQRDDDGNVVQPTKQHKKALQKALLQKISPDVMSFCLAGILWKHNHPDEWQRILDLAVDETPYHSEDDLKAFIRTYLHLLAIAPLPLLDRITVETLYLWSTRDSHNSFGIRSLEDDGSEFFGYGCWPSASYFNHSCSPNIEKKRVERAWEFRAGRDIKAGDELCITYLSGEERRLSRENRMLTLKRNWGFDCRCERCKEQQ
ncbi:SET domain-containing protein [Aaosphaeria arxii CBS 175.79]|uniref:SET domain-containing protein n=1 Tax=Aaosphaeria arxii CBS 175.79 TaxID=1450172 RepID=A0A6A5XCV5_9PLEO|nr:SET domain-containing protein [Aaosphaeria arxii CBS 175.79]KAF2010637.1 SET domain-containing protein [Aaosphaeria arxii CBS 175.79]